MSIILSAIHKLIRNLKTQGVAWNCGVVNSFDKKVKITNQVTSKMKEISKMSGHYIPITIEGIEISFWGVEDNTKIRLTSEMPELDITILLNANMELVKFECFEDDLELTQALLMEYFNRTSDRLIEENSKKQAILNTLKGV